MPGETKTDISGWTVDTLHMHIRTVMDEREERYKQRYDDYKEIVKNTLEANNRAVDKAESMAEKWRANANEWRDAMDDKDKTYLTKSAAWGYVIGMIGFVGGVSGIMFYILKFTGH